VGIGADGGATHRTVAMRKTLPLLTVSLLLIGLVGSAFATTIIDKPTFFGSSNGSYITFSPSLLPLTFSTLYRGSDGYWNFNTTKIKTTVDMTVTVFCSGNWTNYTISGAGTQNIYNGSKPSAVYLDGVSHAENDGWTYTTGTVTVTSATANVKLNFGAASVTEEERDGGGGYSSSLIEIGFLVLLKNAPVEGAQIMLLDVDTNMTLYTMYSDGTGYASTTLKPQEYWLKCEYGEYKVLKKLEIVNQPNQIIHVNLDENEVWQFQLSLSLIGIVVIVLVCVAVVYARSKH